jgi:putative ABC transport system ATP-binding protein
MPQPQLPNPAVRVRDLKFGWIPAQTTLHIAQLDIAAGARLFLHGASGSGKSTLLAMLGGVRIPNSGRVEVLGQDLAQLRGGQRDRFRADHVGFVFQLFNLLPFLSLLDNVLLPCRFSSTRAQRARAAHGSLLEHGRALLLALDLPQSMHQRAVTELSVGQQQRVAVARALAGAPELLICDEPTSALDSDTQGRFLDLLFAQLQQSGSTLVFVSHDRGLATRFDRCLDLRELNQAGIDAGALA